MFKIYIRKNCVVYGNFKSGLWVAFRGNFVVFNILRKHMVFLYNAMNMLKYVYHTLRYLEVTSSMCQHTSHSDMVLLIWMC